MIATYYEDQFCQKIHSFENLENWDDECEANKAYRGYNTWACDKDGVTGTNFWDPNCKIKLSHTYYMWNSCYPSQTGDYFVKYTKTKAAPAAGAAPAAK